MEEQTNESGIVKLLGGPFIAALNVQSKMIDKYLETVKKLAYEDGGEQKGRKTNVLKFLVNRLIKKGKDDDEKLEQVEQEIEVPLISLVTIPALTMKQVSLDLTLEVNSNDLGLSSARPTSEKSRDSDFSPKYIIKMVAEREEPAAGMEKLIEIMTKSMEPVEV